MNMYIIILKKNAKLLNISDILDINIMLLGKIEFDFVNSWILTFCQMERIFCRKACNGVASILG